MLIPQFILNYEIKINKELTQRGIDVQFHITDYNSDTSAILYNLTSKNPAETIPKEADKIIEEYLTDLRQFLKMTNRDLYSKVQP